MDSKYWAFVSYSHSDKGWANWLHRGLETYRVPSKLVGRETDRGYTVPKRIFPIFRDRDELPGSSDLGQNINAALQDSAYLIVISSPRAAVSHWVNEEILTFKSLGREDRVLTIIVDGEPNATDKPESGMLECFPPGLRFQVGADRELLSIPTEPIAADARPTGDGKSRALLKLVAGILGVSFDELVQREAQRHRRSLISFFLFFVTILLAAASFVHVEEQKYIAEQEEVLRANEMVRLEQQKTQQEQAKRQAQAREFAQKQQQDYGKNVLIKGRQEFIPRNYDRALPYLAAAWQINPDSAGLRIMINESLQGLESTPFTGQVFSYGLNGGQVTPDGKEVMAWSALDRAVRFFAIDTGAQLRGFDASSSNAYSINDVCLAPDGKSVVVARGQTPQSKVSIFDAQGGTIIREFNTPDFPLRLQLTHDGKRVAVALKNGVVEILDLATGNIVTSLPPVDAKQGDVDQLVLSPDDQYLAVHQQNQSGIAVFDLTTGQQAWTAAGAQFVQPAFVFSPDSKSMLWTGMKSGFDVLDAATGKQVSHSDLGMSFCPMLISAAYRPDGHAAILGSNSGRAFLYDFASNSAVALPSEPGAIIHVGFSPDGKRAFSAQSGVSLWDASTGKSLKDWPPLSALVSFVCFNPDDSLLVAGSQDGRMRILHADEQAGKVIIASTAAPMTFLLQQEEMVHAETGLVLSLDANSGLSLHGPDGGVIKLEDVPMTQPSRATFSPKGAALGVAFSDGTFGVWNTADGKRIYWSDNLAKGWGLYSLALNDGQVAALYGNGLVACIDFTSQQGVGNFTDPAFANINSILDWTGSKWLIFDGKSTCKVYPDLAKPQPILITRGDTITVAKLSPDGTLLAVGTSKGDVTLWDTTTGKQAGTLPSHPEGALKLMEWSPSGKYLITTENTDEMFLFDTTTKQAVMDYGKVQGIQGVCFTHGDDLIVISVYNGTVGVGDTLTGAPIVLWPVTGDTLGRVTADGDGTRFFVNGSSSVYEWTVAPTVDAAALANALAKDSWKLDGLELSPK